MDFRPLAQTTEDRAITYADAGVDIERSNRTKQRIKYLAHKTFNRGVLSEIGGFGGLFAIDKKRYLDPVLVSSVDGVGTKLKIAFEMNLHHTIGADLVNHCVNDIAVQGAAPMFFMDYFATGKLKPEIAEKVVSGIADACKQNGCAAGGSASFVARAKCTLYGGARWRETPAGRRAKPQRSILPLSQGALRPAG